ncbi:type II/IV secretion system protein [Candidatus Saccharibacteria bacterium]|nr:type II/IV secretion system protein [Candidatus Saccharibacteria bacterium]
MNEDEVQRKRRENEEDATSRRARILGLAYLDTRDFENEIELVPNVLDKAEMHKDFIIPLQKGESNGKPYQFMITSQTPKSTLERMRQEYTDNGHRINFFLISKSAYQVFILRYDPPQQVQYDDIRISSAGDSETISEVSRTLDRVATDKVFDYLLDQADRLGASDIHIENLRHAIRIRMRVDGILHPVAEISRDRYRIFLGELSSRAGISTASRRPQSGHMQTDIMRNGATHLLNIRVEMIPTMYGQDATLRLFNFDESLLNLDLLGITKEERAEIDKIVSHPRGLLMLVGPTGSGKTTTMYSILNALNSTERKIITLEDPIEYGLTGISQIPIETSAGESFAEGLRSVLRLDPDVVMIGEIRDQDTARTAIQASITGHLVLSSFHANSTSAAFSRMIDLIGVNPIFSTSVRLLIAQRLVRKLDENKERYVADAATAKYIREALAGVDTGMNLNGEITLYKEKPSEQHPFGFVGRTAIMEQMVVNEEVQKFIRGDVLSTNSQDIEKAARAEGMLTLEQKGIIAALKGETTIEEIGRVI